MENIISMIGLIVVGLLYVALSIWGVIAEKLFDNPKC